jgi:hypothetical protein
MGAEFKGRVGPNRPGGDGALVGGYRFGFDGELICRDLGGKFFEHIQRGEMFIFSTAVTGVTPAVLGTSTAPMIWNPAGSGKILVPIRILFGGISGTVIQANYNWGYKLNCGSQTGTAAPIVSLTEATPVNALIGSGRASVMKFAPATCSLTGAPTYGGTWGISTGGAMAAGPAFQMAVDLTDGLLAFVPGTAFFPCAANAAIALVTSVSVVALELPYYGN